jgi:hypothetical protein
MVGVRWPALRPLAPKPAMSRSTTVTDAPALRSAIAAESPVNPPPMIAMSTAPSPRHGGAGGSSTSSIHRLGGGPPGSCIAPPPPPW